MPVELARIVKIIGLIREYGPILVDVGVDLKKAYDFVREHKDHPGLTNAERADMFRILNTDVTKIGLPEAGAED